MSVNLGTAVATIVVNADTAGIDKAVQGFNSVSSAAQKATTDGKALGGAMLGIGGAGLAALGGATKVAADFEQQLSNLAAVGGQDAQNQMEAIRETALQLGADTAFSSSEAAAGMTELVKAGVPVQDVLDGAAAAALDLAAATGIEVSQAATYMSTALNVFGDSMTGFATEGEKATRVADLLAQTANASASDIGDIGQALAQVGNVADSFGISLEETTQALGLLSNAGMKGSDAGTSLKTTLLALLDPTKKQKEALAGLGLAYTDFYNSDGSFKGLGATADILAKSMEGLTDEQKQNALAVLFGSDAYRAAKVLTDAGAEGFREFADAQEAAGTVQEQAAIMLDNFNGAFQMLLGSIESVAIKIGSVFLPILTNLVQALTVVVNFIGALPGPILAVGAVLAGLGSAALVGAGGFLFFRNQISEIKAGVQQILIPALKQAIAALTQTGIASNAALGPIGIALAVIAAAVVAYKTNFLGFGDAVDSAFAKVKEAVGAVASAIGGFFAAIGKSFAYFDKTMSAPAAAIRAFGAVLQDVTGLPVLGFFKEIAASVDNAISAITGKFTELKNAFSSGFEGGLAGGANVITSALYGIANAVARIPGLSDFAFALVDAGKQIEAVWERLKSIVTGAIDAIVGKISEIISRFRELVSGGLDPISAAVQALSEGFPVLTGAFTAVGDTIQNVVNVVKGVVGGLVDAFTALFRLDFSGVFAGLSSAAAAPIEGLKNQFKIGFEAIRAFIFDIDWGGVIGSIFSTLGDIGGGAADFARGLYDSLVGAITGIDWGGVVTTIKNAIVGELADIFTGISTTIGDFAGGIGGAFAALGPALDSVAGFFGIDLGAADFFNSIGAGIDSAVAKVREFASAFWDVAGPALSNFAGILKQIASAFVSFAGGAIGAVISKVKEVAAAFASFVGGAVSAVAGKVLEIAGAFASLAGSAIGAVAGKIGEIIGAFAGFTGGAVGGAAGTISNIVSAIASLAGSAIGTVIGYVRDLASAFMGLINDGMSPLDAAVQVLSGAFPALAGAFEFVGGTIGRVLDALGQFKDGISDAVSALFDLDFGGVFDGLSDAFSAPLEFIKGQAAAGAEAIRAFIFDIDWGGVLDTLKDAWVSGFNALKGLAGKALGAVQKEVGKQLDNIKDLFSKIDLKSALSGALEAVKGWVKSISDALKEAASKIDIGAVFGKLGDAVKTAFENIKGIDFQGILSSLWDGIKQIDLGQIAVNVGSWAANAIEDIWTWLKGQVTNVGEGLLNLGNVVVNIGGWAIDAALNVWDAIKSFIFGSGGGGAGAPSPGLGGVAGQGGGITLDNVVLNIMNWGKGVIGDLTGIASEVVNSLKSAIEGVIPNVEWGTVWGAVCGTAQVVFDLVTEAVNKLRLALSSLWSYAKGWLEDIKSWFDSITDTNVSFDGVSGAIALVRSALSMLWSSAQGWIEDLKTWFNNLDITEIWNAVSTAINNARLAISSLWSYAQGWIEDIQGWFDGLDPSFVQGVADAINNVVTGFKDLNADGLISVISTVLDTIATAFTNIKSALQTINTGDLLGKVAEAMGILGAAAKTAADAFVSIVESLGSAAFQKAIDFINLIKGGGEDNQADNPLSFDNQLKTVNIAEGDTGANIVALFTDAVKNADWTPLGAAITLAVQGQVNAATGGSTGVASPGLGGVAGGGGGGGFGASIVAQFASSIAAADWTSVKLGIFSKFLTAITDALKELETNTNTLLDTFLANTFTPFGEAVNTDVTTTFTNVATTVNTKLQEILTAITTYLGTMTTSVATFGTDIYAEISNAMTNFNTAISNGMDTANTNVVNGIQAIIESLSAEDVIGEAEAAGLNFAEGYAVGIYSGVYLAEEAARFMAEAALTSLNETQVSESPSKMTEQSGKWFGEGYADGIMAMADEARQAAADLFSSALSGVDKQGSKTKLGESWIESIKQSIIDGITQSPSMTSTGPTASETAAMDALRQQKQYSTQLEAALNRSSDTTIEVTTVIDDGEMGRYVIGKTLAPMANAAERVGRRRTRY